MTPGPTTSLPMGVGGKALGTRKAGIPQQCPSPGCTTLPLTGAFPASLPHPSPGEAGAWGSPGRRGSSDGGGGFLPECERGGRRGRKGH